MTPDKFSVIIPSFNEAARIEKAIQCVLLWNRRTQVIVADCGSSDDTASIARCAGVEVIESNPGRGVQCNAGAKRATGDVFVFLHADTIVPLKAFELLERFFENGDVQVGTFRLAFDENRWLLRAYAAFTRFDTLLTRFGDQCIVIRKSFFEELGGFPDWPLFEDVHLLRMARRRTRIHSFPARVTTSARRFTKTGLVRTQMINGWLMLQYLLGVSPVKLAGQYQ
jgi:rSAM/selenodomain-associated transferase 2